MFFDSTNVTSQPSFSSDLSKSNRCLILIFKQRVVPERWGVCIHAPVSEQRWYFPLETGRCYLSQSPQEAAVVRLRDVDGPRRRGAAPRSAVIHAHRPPRLYVPVSLRSGLAHLRFVTHHRQTSELWHMVIKQNNIDLTASSLTCLSSGSDLLSVVQRSDIRV